MSLREPSPWVTRGLYLFAALLVLSPWLDLVSTVWPLRFGDLQWRYGFLGLGAGYLQTPVLGFVIASLVAIWTRDAGAQRVLGTVMVSLGVLLVAGMAMFLLDSLQVRDLREPEVRNAVLVSAILQEVKYAGSALVLFVLGYGALRGARHESRRH